MSLNSGTAQTLSAQPPFNIYQMKFLLSPNYVLRGWKYLPCAYVNLNTGEATFIPESDFSFLMHCDGKHEIPNANEKKIQQYAGMGIISESSNSLLPQQLYRKYSSRFINKAHWAITNKCNFKCKHCFISAPHSNLQDISYSDCCKIIDELYSCGIFRLSITGGEPLIHKDFTKILEYAKNRSITITDLYTNGSLITEPILLKIKEIGINPTFQISYDGKNTHAWIRGNSHAEEIVKNAIKIIKKHGFKVRISCCLYNDNINYIAENIKEYSSLGVDGIDFGLISQIGEWKNIKQKNAKTEDILEAIISSVPAIVSMKLPIEINLAGFIKFYPDFFYLIPMVKHNMDKEQLHCWVCCESMRNSLYINPKGNLVGCEMLTGSSIQRGFPNILHTPLKDILIDGNIFMDFIDQRLSRLEENNKECALCAFYHICHGGCRGNANNAGNYWGIDPVACTFFKKGYYDKILKLMENLGVRNYAV